MCNLDQLTEHLPQLLSVSLFDGTLDILHNSDGNNSIGSDTGWCWFDMLMQARLQRNVRDGHTLVCEHPGLYFPTKYDVAVTDIPFQRRSTLISELGLAGGNTELTLEK